MRGDDVIPKSADANRPQPLCHLVRRPFILDPLFASIKNLEGVGDKQKLLFDRLLHRTDARILDLLFLMPNRRQGLIQVAGDSLPEPGSLVEIEVLVEQHLPSRTTRQPRRIRSNCSGQTVDLVFFKGSQAELSARFPIGTTIRVRGRLDLFQDRWQIVHPRTGSPAVVSSSEDRAADGEGVPKITIYPATLGLSQATIAKTLIHALRKLPDLGDGDDPNDGSPDALPSFRDALFGLHGQLPSDANNVFDWSLEDCRRRLARDELLAVQTALVLSRRSRQDQPGRSISCDRRLWHELQVKLPFAPTRSQLQAIDTIYADMAAPEAMTRLLQGDVGAGKTLVALAAMLRATAAGKQAVLMAPTDILARQHAKALDRLLARIDLSCTLLTATMSKPDRDAASARIASGAASLIVGTHALFQDRITFRDLALAVIDEQHRFGVHQRLRLRQKGAMPDLLLLTATPIPRSLVLTLYGDIAASKLYDKPGSRKPITTTAKPLNKIDDVLLAVERVVTSGGQVYWVCPAIGDELDDDEGPANVSARTAWLQDKLTSHGGLKIENLHGRLPGAERDRRMLAFAQGTIDILVATTVVEVGIDVPNAVAIVIECAERFGLAQLHQLRGRVGRGVRQSNCVLLYKPPLSRTAHARIDLLRRSGDGFEIAEEDLRLRGAGEVLGVRQSGQALFHFADLASDLDLLEWARDRATRILNEDPDLTGRCGKHAILLTHLFDRAQSLAMMSSG